MFNTPFDVDVNTIFKKFQIDLVEMQSSDELKAKFRTKSISLLDFYKKYMYLHESGLYLSLTNNAKEMATIFGSTYTFEQLFSTMKFTKSKPRSRIFYAHLEGVLLLASSDLSPVTKQAALSVALMLCC